MSSRNPAGDASVSAHCREINRCNQRGGRMLSIVDLMDAGTVTPELAGYLLAAVGDGASFMVGALPGGAGKTTVMGALLNMVPADVELVPTDDDEVVRQAADDRSRRRCYICHEIGSGYYYAYLWGPVLTDLLRLPTTGHMVATNLHADTIDQARDQLCGDNAVPEDAFDQFGLMLFLHMTGGWSNRSRRIAAVYEPSESGPPRLVYTLDRKGRIVPGEPSGLVGADALAQAVEGIETLRDNGAQTIQQVRTFLIHE
jgi:hypothetical protein